MMMMNQGSNASVDPNSVENRHVANGNAGQAGASYYPSTSGAEASAWPAHQSTATDNRAHSQTMYQYNQPTQPAVSSAPSLGTVNAPQDYSSYTTYTNPADPYGYGTQGYRGYYNNYQQQPNQSYQQPIGAYQNTGAPYQPISSFQNTGSYAGSASYTSTYYNPADYQTAGGYASSGYTNPTNQTTTWNGGNYANNTPQQYAPYTPEASGVYSSAPSNAAPQNYQQQWADYYSRTEVSCAPGTENLSVNSTQNVGCPVPGVTTGYQTSVSQPLPPPPPLPSYAPSWRPESISELPAVQSGSVVGGAQDTYWNHVVNTSQSQIQHVTSNQAQFQRPLDQNSSYDSFQDQQTATTSQASSVQYPNASQPPYVSHSYQSPSEAAPSIDAQRLNKLQIPTNPRITVGSQKTGKDINMASPAVKPAYISVSLPKPVDKVPSISSTDSLLKTGMFPKSLRGYVERALARCKDDNQMAASQVVMKQIITKATADSTLYTRDWDTEPLFPVPNEDDTNKALNSSNLVSSLTNLKRSPSRRAKSRWEPLLEEKTEKPAERPVSLNSGQNNAVWGHVNDKDRKPFVWGRGSKNSNMSNAKFPSLEQKSGSKILHQPFKKQRLSDGVDAAENGDASSESDPDQGLAAYYAGAMAFADSPEERKRREHRSKRFEKVQSHRGQNNHLKPKNAGAGNLYTRRTNALVLSKFFEDGVSRAVEDIDWDSLTVKGTCQEIEKRYLRLTSAPDPATVRPEDVLQKALLMVHNSLKNYLYKCDQLKSIRQDLTVQRIRNHLTVKVYETHARLALEVGDLPEYNQCQSQLKSLYADGIEGCHMEFSAYNLLCVILHSNNNRDLLSSMASLSAETKKHEAVKHALAVRGAVTSGNYVMFFRLYKKAPNLSTCLMDLYVEKMRFKAVSCMCRSYRPTIPVSYIAQILGFATITPNEESQEKDSEGLEECIEWLKLHGASLIADSNGEMQVDAKSTSSSLYMPETDAVSHGDANLAVNDFFTRAPT